MSTELPHRREDAEGRFRDLFERCYGPVMKFFEKRGFSREESHDLAQEAFLLAYRGFDRFRGEASSESWLFTIAGNVAKNAWRRQSAQKRSGPELAATHDGKRPLIRETADLEQLYRHLDSLIRQEVPSKNEEREAKFEEPMIRSSELQKAEAERFRAAFDKRLLFRQEK